MNDDQDIITLDSDDEAEADLIVGPTGTAVPFLEAHKQGLAARMAMALPNRC
jgi:hypothetical protein